MSSSTGNWKGLVEIPSISLEEPITVLEGVEKKDFICFARKMLQWDSERRKSQGKMEHVEVILQACTRLIEGKS